MKIAIVVDNPFRDLGGLVLLAMELCRRGATCVLVPHNLVVRARELFYLAPDFALVNYLRVNNQETVRGLLDAGIPVGVLDTEGGVLKDLDECVRWQAADAGVRNRVAGYFCWGSKTAAHAVSRGWYGEGQVEVTGVPRFDFYAGAWRRAALAVSPHADAFRRPMVLLSGNFTLANPQFQTPEKEARMYARGFGYGAAFVRDWQAKECSTMLEMTGLANDLAEAFPEATFVWRPHPFEKLETYHALLRKRDNLHAVKQGSVDGWILRASALVHRNCSTAIEAGLSDVPSLTPEWIAAPLEMPSVNAVTLRCRDRGELVGRLRAILRGAEGLPDSLKARLGVIKDEWFCAADGAAHERVAKTLLDRVPSDGRKKRIQNCRDVLYRGGNSARARLGARLRKFLSLQPDWSFSEGRPVGPDLSPWDGSEKRYGVDEVRRIADAIRVHAPKPFGNVRVSSSVESGDYHFGFTAGRSVTLAPA